MPELPEVETVVRGLRKPLIGHTVLDMWYDWPRTLHSPPPTEFAARIKGQRFVGVNRRAKYILCELEHDILVVHLKMTGRLYVADNDTEDYADKWVHFGLQLDGSKQLRFSDFRKFGRVYLTNDIDALTAGIGPEPLDDAFTLDVFRERLAGRHKVIKSLLLDQTFIAGVGNIYADESLHRAGIHPLRRSDSLTDAEVIALHGTIQASLRDGIAREGASVSWYRKPDGTQGEMQEHLYVYGREGEPCYTCGTSIDKIRVGQRGTHYCPNCQPSRT